MPAIRSLPVVLMTCSLLAPLPTFALDSTVESGMEVAGRVDLDGLGPAPAVSNLLENATTAPFTVSQIDVADSAAKIPANVCPDEFAATYCRYRESTLRFGSRVSSMIRSSPREPIPSSCGPTRLPR